MKIKVNRGKQVVEAPKKLYLQWTGTDEQVDQDIVPRDADVTWCRDRINQSDIVYIRQKRYARNDGR